MAVKQLNKLKNNGIVRDSNIELYRIISMLLIVAHHYVVNSGLTNILYSNPWNVKSLFLLIMGAFGKTGINCFLLITGYFMCKSQISAKKFAKLLFEVEFYRIILNGIFWISGYAPFTLSAFLKAIIPFTSVAQNFTGTFLLFFLFIPFLNILVNNLNEKQHILLLLISGFTYIFFGTVPFFSVTMNYVSWYMVLYFIASYIRLYPKKAFDSKKLWAILTAVSVLLAILSVIAGAFLKVKTGRNIIYYFVVDSNTFLAVAMGVSSFMLFKNIKIKPSRFINAVASTCFGVLMIHANSATMRHWLWVDVLNNVGTYKSSFIYIHAILSPIIIFAVCALIDILRIRFIEKPFFEFWDKHWEKVVAKYKKLETKIVNKLEISE